MQGQAEAPTTGDEMSVSGGHPATRTAGAELKSHSLQLAAADEPAEQLGAHAALPGSLSNADELAGQDEVVLGSLPSRHPRQKLDFWANKVCEVHACFC